MQKLQVQGENKIRPLLWNKLNNQWYSTCIVINEGSVSLTLASSSGKRGTRIGLVPAGLSVCLSVCTAVTLCHEAFLIDSYQSRDASSEKLTDWHVLFVLGNNGMLRCQILLYFPCYLFIKLISFGKFNYVHGRPWQQHSWPTTNSALPQIVI